MSFFYYDWTMWIIIPALILSIYAQTKVTNMFKKYNKINTLKGSTGADVARAILSQAGISNVNVELSTVKGLSDNYNPKDNTIRLSKDVYNSTSISAVGVAAHECGHAIQYAKGYGPIKLRSLFVPIAQIGSTASIPMFFIGLIFAWQPLLIAGIIFFATTTIFYLITLPVEFNASSRALKILGSSNFVEQSELVGCKSVLDAAALTYIAAALSSILTLVRLMILSDRSN